jgi:hypothetical protein
MSAWIVTTLKATTRSHWMIQSPWLWPLCEALHFVGLALLVGVVGMLDLRLLGRMRHLSFSAVHRLIPWGILGFDINLVTGPCSSSVHRTNTSPTPRGTTSCSFWGSPDSTCCTSRRDRRSGRSRSAPASTRRTPFKVIGAVSILPWFTVLYWGRMLPFIGNAF